MNYAQARMTTRSCLRWLVPVAAAVAGIVVGAAAPASTPTLGFQVFARTAHNMRCVLSPGTHGFTPGVICCNSPDNKIYEISADGTQVQVLATLPTPYPPASDGSLTFDTGGSFGNRLVAATGRSGAGGPPGGVVFAIDSAGHVQKVGSYPGPGGADEVAIAPPGFGSAAGDALLAVDPGVSGGALVAMDGSGHTRRVVAFPDGPNPVVPIPKTVAPAGTPAPGLYLTDDSTKDVYFAPAAQLARFAGDVLVGSEVKAHFWIIEPRGSSFVKVAVRHNLRGGRYSLEAATFVG